MKLVLRQSEVEEATGLSKSTIWRLMKVGLFPQKVQLGPRAVGWRAEEIVQWCKNRSEAKNTPIGKKRGTAEKGLGSEERDQGQM